MFKFGGIRRGYTLVEILVVIAIVSVLAGISVAGVATLGAGSKQELSRSTRHLHTLLHAASVYADTFNVKTAVVYNMDNYVDPPGPNALAEPLQDPVTGQGVRVITAAAVLYELPRTHPFPGKYVPVPDEKGLFHHFEGEQVLMLNDLEPGPNYFQPYYYSPEARYNEATENDPFSGNQLDQLGMNSVETFIGDTGPFAPILPTPQNPLGGPNYRNPTIAAFPAHVFAPGGRLVPGSFASSVGGARERYTLYIAPPPQADISEHLVFPNIVDPTDPRMMERVHRKIYLYRSTGRVKTAS